MNDELTVKDISDADAPETATEQLDKGDEQTYDSTPLREFFYGKKTDLSDEDIEALNTVWGFYAVQSNGPGEKDRAVLGQIATEVTP